MKFRNLIVCLFLGFTVASCIQDEAPNAEADILTCIVPNGVLNRTPIIGNNEIVLIAKEGASISDLALEFTMTPGATIKPENKTVRDFTKSHFYTYTVTSQDGKWTKEYIVKILPPINTDYHFEDFVLHKNQSKIEDYYIFRELYDNGNEIFSWASGNEGFAFTGVKATPAEYPTTLDTKGYVGNCLKLQTKNTGSLGESVGMPLAAGNLFLGSFSINLADVLSATSFGVPFMHIPTTLKGYYKYKAGEKFYKLNADKKLEYVPNKKDMCDIYAVFYETDENLEILNGHNILTDPHIISIARIANAKETEDWTKFDLDFQMLANRKIEEAKLKDGKYNLAVVFSSSIDGAYFEGAPSSTLYIDEVEIGYEGKK